MHQYKNLLIASLMSMCLVGCSASAKHQLSDQTNIERGVQQSSFSNYSSVKTLAAPVQPVRLGAGDHLGEAIYKNYTRIAQLKLKTPNKDIHILEILKSENQSLSDKHLDNNNWTLTIQCRAWVMQIVEGSTSTFHIFKQQVFNPGATSFSLAEQVE